MAFAIPPFDAAPEIFVRMAPGMPPECWGVTACVLAILAFAAIFDSLTALIPEALIFFGLLAVTAAQGVFASWEIAAHHLQQAVAAGILIWLINYAWFKKFHADALGMGDAKWTMLAVACFGIEPAIMAWGVGSVLATIFIGLFRLFKHSVSAVTFSPFLFIGLGVALYRGSVLSSF
jgi:prepilin signal peptidase PulO-like enzyme (type II secretory pathway)